MSVNHEVCVVGSCVDEQIDVHCEFLVVVDRVVNVNDTEQNVIKQVGRKPSHDDVPSLDVVNLLEDGYGVVNAVNLWCVDESGVNAGLSEDDVHLNDGKVVDKI